MARLSKMVCKMLIPKSIGGNIVHYMTIIDLVKWPSPFGRTLIYVSLFYTLIFYIL